MAISEPCPQCGRPRPVPESSTGELLLCSECSGAVDAEPIYDAELVEPVSELTGETSPAPPADTLPRRPCPVCRELIVATAVHCRFCGEVFDEALHKPRRAGTRKPGAVFAAHRTWLVCVFLTLGCIFGGWGLVAQSREHPSPLLVPGFLAIAAIYVVLTITAMIAIYRLVEQMSGGVAALLASILGLVPCLGLLVDVLVYQRALDYDPAGVKVPDLDEEL